MGSSQHKDKNIDLYLETTKDLYLAGEWVEGAVYINALQPSLYTSLALKLDCWQQCYWAEHSGNQYHTVTNHNHNKVCNYSQTLWLNNFGQNGIYQGHYTFPFRLLLPEGLPGSFKQDSDNYIKYSLMAELMPASNHSQKLYPQTYHILLNIDEPLRMPFGPASQEIINKPQSCGCCCSYGTVRILLSCDKNVIRPGDNVSIKALIDNSHGQKSIKNIVFQLERNVIKISDDLRQLNDSYEKLILYSSKKVVPEGGQETIEFQNSIPLNYSSKSTAIGTVISNYFTLRISSSMGCCSDAADAQLHLVYQSNARQLEPMKKVSPPPNWNPIVAKPNILNNLKPYVYRPQASLIWYNRAVHPGMMNAGNLQQMGSIEALNGPNTHSQPISILNAKLA